MQITVRDLMTSQPLTLTELATVEEATRKILENAASEAYIVDQNGRLLGVVSDFSLLKARLIPTDTHEPVTQFLSRSMILLNPDMRLDEVIGYFRESCHARLVVVDGGRVVGQLSRRDVLRAMVVLEELATSDYRDESVAESIAVSSRMLRRVEPGEQAVPPQPSGRRARFEEASDASAKSPSALTAR